MSMIELNTEYTNGIDMRWSDIEKQFPDKCVYYSNMRCDNGSNTDIDRSTVTVHGIYDLNKEQYGVDMMFKLIDSGINVGSSYTGEDNGGCCSLLTIELKILDVCLL